MLKHRFVNCASLYDAAVLSNVAPHYYDAAGFRIRAAYRLDEVKVLYFMAFNVFTDCLSVCRNERLVNEALLVKFVKTAMSPPALLRSCM